MMHALDRDSLEVYLQPIVNAETEKVEGAEALVRLTEADGRIIPPDEFIPAAPYRCWDCRYSGRSAPSSGKAVLHGAA